METNIFIMVNPPRSSSSFNFLASLINGNFCFYLAGQAPTVNVSTFNFLASLINGNT